LRTANANPIVVSKFRVQDLEFQITNIGPPRKIKDRPILTCLRFELFLH